MKRLMTVIFAASVFCLAGCCTTQQHGSTTEHAITKWEYKTVVDDEASAENLTRLGQQGWSVVSFNPYAGADGGRHIICLLKRPTQ